MPFYPGLGVGGHCIPDDPLYLYWKAKRYGFDSKYIKLSADTNAQMPAYVIRRIAQALQERKKTLKKAKILVVGVTYKKDVRDLRKSPSLNLIRLLQEQVSKVDYFDPLIPYLEIFNIHQKVSVVPTPESLRRYDCVVIATDHSQIDYQKLLKHARLVFDTRNVYKSVRSAKVIRL
jgi:UDP-N-acetyl-D-glucosamine dehydrogenase